MYNYAQDLDTFLYKAEFLLSQLVLDYIEDRKITLQFKEYIYALAAGIDVLQTLELSGQDTEQIISYLLEEYEIDNIGLGPYNSYNQIHLHPHGGGLLPHKHTMDDVIGLIQALNDKVDVSSITQVVLNDPNVIPSSQAVFNFFQEVANNSGDNKLERDIMSGVTLAGITINDLLKGKDNNPNDAFTFTDVFELLFTKRAVAPSLGVSQGTPTLVERGTTLINEITGIWNQNDAGVRTMAYLFRGLTPLTVNQGTFKATENYIIGVETITYTAKADYAAGPTGFSGAIPAGSITSGGANIIGAYASFLGLNAAMPNNSAGVRALPTKVVQNKVFSIIIPAGTTSVVLAYVSTISDLGDLNVKDFASNVTVGDNYGEPTLVSVLDANGANPVNYKVYRYAPVGGFPVGTKHDFTLP